VLSQVTSNPGRVDGRPYFTRSGMPVATPFRGHSFADVRIVLRPSTLGPCRGASPVSCSSTGRKLVMAIGWFWNPERKRRGWGLLGVKRLVVHPQKATPSAVPAPGSITPSQVKKKLNRRSVGSVPRNCCQSSFGALWPPGCHARERRDVVAEAGGRASRRRPSISRKGLPATSRLLLFFLLG